MVKKSCFSNTRLPEFKENELSLHLVGQGTGQEQQGQATLYPSHNYNSSEFLNCLL